MFPAPDISEDPPYYDDYDPYDEVNDEEDEDSDDHGWFHFLDHEWFLFMFSPVEEEDVSVFEVLKVAGMTIKLIEAQELREEEADEEIEDVEKYFDEEVVNKYYGVDDYHVTAVLVKKLVGGKKSLEQIRQMMKKVKKFVMSSLRASLSQVLPISLEEDILDNILRSMNLLDADQDAKDDWKFVEDSVEEKNTLSGLYDCISKVFREMRDDLFSHPGHAWDIYRQPFHGAKILPGLINQLQEVVSGVVGIEESTEEGHEEDEADEVKVTNQEEAVVIED